MTDGGLRKACQHFRARNREAFPGAKVERHAFPAPGIDLQAQRNEGFNMRIPRQVFGTLERGV